MYLKNDEVTNETPISFLTVGQFLTLFRKEHKAPPPEKRIPEIYGVETLQEITGYSRPTIYAKTSRNEIPHFKRDGRLYFRHSEIVDWLTENRIETVAEFCRRKDAELVNKTGRV
jgi:predicted DNA-binding transcriptional regulator AlpA